MNYVQLTMLPCRNQWFGPVYHRTPSCHQQRGGYLYKNNPCAVVNGQGF
jgi:hypothetical protein